MARYGISGRTTLVTATAAAPLAMLLKAAANPAPRCYIVEVGIFLASAVASTIGLARSTTATTTPTSLGTPTPFEENDVAATGIAAIAWTTVGAATGIPVKRITLPATIGAGVVWQFYDKPIPLKTGATGELLLLNQVAVTPGVFDFYVNWDE